MLKGPGETDEANLGGDGDTAPGMKFVGGWSVTLGNAGGLVTDEE